MNSEARATATCGLDKDFHEFYVPGGIRQSVPRSALRHKSYMCTFLIFYM